MMRRLDRATTNRIDELVRHFSAHEDNFRLFLDAVRGAVTTTKELSNLIHSVKWRVKDPDHLRDKLRRKAQKLGPRESFDITTEDLFFRINDLAGFRLLHLYTRQMREINAGLLHLFDAQQYRLIEGPIARTWDDESREYFREAGIETKESPSMYTSVHYVIEANTRTKYTCEVQVRTLMEEVWGEVDHAINYPYPVSSVACVEQIKVLARVTSSCTRLVDSIFRSHEDASPADLGAIPNLAATRGGKPGKRVTRRRI